MDVCYEFGKWLRKSREDAGLSLRQLARLARANHSYLARLEHGRHASPSRQMVLRLARALRIRGNDALAAAGYMPEGRHLQNSAVKHSPVLDPEDQARTEASSSWRVHERERVQSSSPL